MNISDEKRSLLFNFLDELSELDRHALEMRFSEDLVNSVRLIFCELIGNEEFPDSLTAAQFPELIFKLREIKRTWSRELGNAIIFAAENADNGHVQIAIDILKSFQEVCPSPFYNGIAQVQIDRYKIQENEF